MINQLKTLTDDVTNGLTKNLSEETREKFKLKVFTLFEVPMLGYCKPELIQISNQSCEIKFPLNRRTKNHLNSMYFGALSCGADLAGGLIAMKVINDMGENISLVFKDFKADFLKRAEGDTHFICRDGHKVERLVNRTVETGERENETVEVVATVPSKFGDEPVARFLLTLSLKKRKKS